MEDVIYVIDYYDGDIQYASENEMHELVDDIIDDIKRLRKKYKWETNIFRMTLYTSEESFEATEYIVHYRGLSAETYGPHFLTEFDVELIRKLNF